MENFKLFALGEKFDVDKFVEDSSLHPSYIWRKGERQQYSCISSLYPTSGIEFKLGTGEVVPLHVQQKIAIAFIQKNRGTLQRLSRFPGVTDCTLGLEYINQFEENVVGFCMSVSNKLMCDLVDIGFELTHYVTLERKHFDDET